MKCRMANVSVTKLYVQCFALIICQVPALSFEKGLVAQNRHVYNSPLQKILHALNKLDEVYKHRGGGYPKSMFKGKLTCKINGEIVTSEMRIALGKGLRVLEISDMQRITCKKPDASIVETSSMKGQWSDAGSSDAKGTTLKLLAFITTSGRYSNILYGVGPRLKIRLPILRFDLAAGFSVTEHIVLRKVTTFNSGKEACGWTTGPCPGEKRQCLFYCFCLSSRGPCKAKYFPDLSYDLNHVQVNCKRLNVNVAVKRGVIRSISVDTDGKMYLIVISKPARLTKLIISSVTFSVRETTLKVLKVFHLEYDTLTTMDVSRNGLVVIKRASKVEYFEIEKIGRTFELKNIKAVFGIEQYISSRKFFLVCWLNTGNGLVAVSNKSPFKRRNFVRQKTRLGFS